MERSLQSKKGLSTQTCGGHSVGSEGQRAAFLQLFGCVKYQIHFYSEVLLSILKGMPLIPSHFCVVVHSIPLVSLGQHWCPDCHSNSVVLFVFLPIMCHCL